jgi:hypothetical protein
MKYALVDIDNCISDDVWRRPRSRVRTEAAAALPVQLQRLHEYHMLAPFDRPVLLVQEEIVLKNLVPIIVTARPELYRPHTLEWLRRNFEHWGVDDSRLYMRHNNDVNESALVKRKALQAIVREHMASSDDIVCAYDDDLNVLRMYDSSHIPVCRCDIAFGIFEHLTKGRW